MPAALLLILGLVPVLGGGTPDPEGFLPLLMVPLVGACLGIGGLALLAGAMGFRKHPVLLPSNVGVALGTILLMLPQLGALHSPFLRLAFAVAVMVHLALSWEWYTVFQPFRTLLLGMDLESVRPLVQEASLVAQERIAALGRPAPGSSLFDVELGPHRTLDRVVVMRTNPQAYAFIFFFRLELRRLLERQTMRRPSYTPHLILGGSALVGLAFWLTSMVA